ncbi:MAG: hypothetical protein ACRDKL_03490, partial [Solirubrobacteraceae bacterium]
MNSSRASRRRRPRARYVVPALLVAPLAAAAVLAAVVAHSKTRIRPSSVALAAVVRPLGGGRIVAVSAVGGTEQKDVPVTLRGDQVWPTAKVAPGERITVLATVRRPGWISWLSGSQQQVKLTVVAPVARLASKFITRAAGEPLRVRFVAPVQVVGSGTPGRSFDPHTLSEPQGALTLRARGAAGTVTVAAAVRPWERLVITNVSWFPRGRRATVVASPRPGRRINPLTPITLTFSKPVNEVLGNRRPPVTPITPGVWHKLNAHTIAFRPRGYGYGLGATVRVLLPAGVRLMGVAGGGRGSTRLTRTVTKGGAHATKTAGGSDPVVGTWSVPQPSTEALQGLLAQLGYLPVSFTPDPTGSPPEA